MKASLNDWTCCVLLDSQDQSTAMRMKRLEPGEVINRLGGTVAVAKLCGDISPQAVSQWKSAGIPKPWVMFLREIRPDVFGAKKAIHTARSS
jgi:hypothetical protein